MRWPSLASAFVLAALGCHDPTPATPDGPSVDAPAPVPDGPGRSHLSLFGYVGVSCGVDYLAEVQAFTNMGHLCVFDPVDLRGRLQAFAAAGVGALLDLHFLFFTESTDPPLGGSGAHYVLRPDYLTRWATFLDLNRSALAAPAVAAIYPAEEPTWLGVSPADLQAVASLVKRDLPALPLLLIEAHQGLEQLVIPDEYDIVGMDFYGAIDPGNGPAFAEHAALNAQYLPYYAALKARRTRTTQRTMLVFDAQWADIYGQVGYSEEDLADFVRNYHQFALGDPDVIGLIGYVWLSGLDGPDYKGLRDLPASVRDANAVVGRAISGK